MSNKPNSFKALVARLRQQRSSCSNAPGQRVNLLFQADEDLHDRTVRVVDQLVATNMPPTLFLRDGSAWRVGPAMRGRTARRSRC